MLTVPDLRRPYAAVLLTAAFLSFCLALKSAWIPAKAVMAQWLLSQSWQAIRAGDSLAVPWPWADTRPAAVLKVPRMGIEQFVLQGSSGRNLAFGPVLMNRSANAATGSQDRIINGHRDTHFSFLEQLRAGDVIHMETAETIQEYRVVAFEIVDSSEQELVLEPDMNRLTLVTCYPFRAALAGGPLRYVVTALPAGQEQFSQTLPRSSG